MYSVVLIDDEVFSIELLKKFFSQSFLDFDICAEFSNPVEALEYIKKNNVDVIITDIKMPVVTGIDIAKYCHYNKPEIKVIFLSGYSDFEYARQGISYNVFSYITKPFSRASLTQTLSELYTVLEKNKSSYNFFDDESNDLIRKCFINVVSDKKATADDAISRLNNLGLDIKLENAQFAVLSAEITNSENYFSEKWKYNEVRFVHALEKLVNKEYSCGYTGLSFFYVSGFDIFFISKPAATQKSIKDFFDTYIVSITREISACLQIEPLFYDIFITDDISKLKIYYNELSAKKKRIEVNQKTSSMLEAKKYIDKYYYEELTLKSLAERFSFNPTYFSELFFKHFDTSFSNYLKTTRLEAAKKLIIDSDVKITAVPSLVGLSSFPSFSKSFKQYTGYSPIEYKEKYRKL